MSNYEISKSSLLSLKAEILRKQQELLKEKTNNDVKIRHIKKKSVLEIKNKGIQERNEKDKEYEDEDILRQSSKALEIKSKLYDKLSKAENLDEDEIKDNNQRYLVRFDRKNKSQQNYSESEDENINEDDYEARNEEDEWVEYVDCLGRTRTCLRKDLDFLKTKDCKLKDSIGAETDAVEESFLDEVKITDNNVGEIKNDKIETLENEIPADDTGKTLLHQQWEEQEENIRNKSNVHYQDILFNEARTHGVGYYEFSKDEEERAKQQEELKKLRQETEKEQKKSQDLKALREKQLAARVKAARNRKRARMGLPPEEDEPEPEKPTEEPLKEPEPEKIETITKPHKIRPWDIGKIPQHYEQTQEEWNETQRKLRPNEFAPPSYGRTNFRSNINVELEDTFSEPKQNLRFSTKKGRKRSINPYKSEMQEEECFSETNTNDLSRDKNMTKMKPYKTNYNETGWSYDINNKSEVEQPKRAEVAPPATYDYYGPSSSKKSKAPFENNISEAVEAGLKFLRTKIENNK